MCSFLKGMGAGMIVGACVGMSLQMDRRGKRMIHKAIRNVENMLDDLGENFMK